MNDRIAGYRLIESGVGVLFRVREEQIQTGPDEAEFQVRLELEFEPDDADVDVEDIVEISAFGFMFVLAALSFGDARPRESSVIDYQEQDELSVGDFISCLAFRHGALDFNADYIRGRRMKTQITVRPDGTVTLITMGRGKAALRWLDRIQGKRLMSIAGKGTDAAGGPTVGDLT